MGAFGVSSIYRAPGLTEIAEQAIEELLLHPEAMFKKGVTLAAGYPVIKVGDVLSMITTGANAGKYRRYTPVAAQNARVTGDNTVVVKDLLGNVVAPPFVAGEIISIGAQASKTVASVNNATGTITITGTMGGSITAGDAIILTTADGSDVAAGIAARPITGPLYNPASPNANNVLDADYLVDVIWQGIVRRSVVRGLDAGAMTDLGAVSLQPFMDGICIR